MATMLILAPAAIIIGKSGDFTVHVGQAGIFQISSPALASAIGLELNINVARHNTIPFDVAEISTFALEFGIKTTERKVIVKTPPPHRAWQARLGSRMDTILKKAIDNKISLSSFPIDMVRVQVNKDPRTHDIISRSVSSYEIMPLYFTQALDELPLRRVEYSDTQQIVLTIDGTKLTDIKVKCPLSQTLNRGDILFRILRDDYSERPIVLVLQVKDELGMIGYSSLLQIDYILSYYDEELPDSILDAVIASTNKREELQW